MFFSRVSPTNLKGSLQGQFIHKLCIALKFLVFLVIWFSC